MAEQPPSKPNMLHDRPLSTTSPYLKKRSAPSFTVTVPNRYSARLRVEKTSQSPGRGPGQTQRPDLVQHQVFNRIRPTKLTIGFNYQVTRGSFDLHPVEKVELNIDMDDLFSETRGKLDQVTKQLFCQQVSVFASNWRKVVSVLDTFGRVLTLLHVTQPFTLEAGLNEDFEKSLKALRKLNKTFVFSQPYSLLKMPFVVPNSCADKPGLLFDQLTNASLDSAIELSFRDDMSLFPKETKSQDQRMKLLREAKHQSAVKLKFPPEGKFTEDLQSLFKAKISKNFDCIDVQKHSDRLVVNHTGNYAVFFRRKGAIWQFLERHGLVGSVDITTERTIEQNEGGMVKFNEPKLMTVYTIVSILVRHGFLGVREAKNAVLKAWNDPLAAQYMTSAFTRFKNIRFAHCKSMNAELMTGNVWCFKENLLIEETVNYGFYMSRIVSTYICAGHFDALFIDGTYLKGYKNGQLLIMRLYSSSSKEMLNCAYAMCEKRDTENYERILNRAAANGFLTNVQVVVSDFEMAFTRAFRTVLPNAEHRFCFFHLVSATRRYAGKINKSIDRLGYKIPRVTFRLSLIMSYLLLSKKDSKQVVFVFIDLFCRLKPLSLADYMFIRYFTDTYLNRYTVVVGDLEKFPFLTNNTVEGTNSGLKKFIFGKDNVIAVREWLAHDVKRTVMNFSKQLFFEINPLMLEIQRNLNLNRNWYLSIINKAFETHPRRPKALIRHTETLALLSQVLQVKIQSMTYRCVVGTTTHTHRIPSNIPELPKHEVEVFQPVLADEIDDSDEEESAKNEPADNQNAFEAFLKPIPFAINENAIKFNEIIKGIN